jgi:hypothetical protein
MKTVEVRDSKINAKGVFATRPITKGDVILAIDDSVIISRDDPVLGRLIGSEPDPCDFLPDGTIVLMQEPERYINHSCDPNVYVYTVDNERFVLAMRDIPTGAELVFDYAIGFVGGDWLDCLCGASACRGRHRSDFFALPIAKQREYLPYHVVSISVPDLDEAKRFYRDVLGLGAPIYDLPDAGWIEFSSGGPSGNIAVTKAEDGCGR